MENKRKEEPIYEKLGPNEVLVISKEDDCITVAVNEGGQVKLKKVCMSG